MHTFLNITHWDRSQFFGKSMLRTSVRFKPVWSFTIDYLFHMNVTCSIKYQWCNFHHWVLFVQYLHIVKNKFALYSKAKYIHGLVQNTWTCTVGLLNVTYRREVQYSLMCSRLVWSSQNAYFCAVKCVMSSQSVSQMWVTWCLTCWHSVWKKLTSASISNSPPLQYMLLKEADFVSNSSSQLHTTLQGDLAAPVQLTVHALCKSVGNSSLQYMPVKDIDLSV